MHDKLGVFLKYFYWPFQGGASFVDHYVISVLFCYAFMHVCLLMTCGHPLGRANLWLLFVTYNCDVVTFPLVSLVRCGA